MSTVPAKRADEGERLLFDGVTWQRYLRILRAFDRTNVRITYDRGEMEIMTISPPHEWFKSVLGVFVWVLVEELGWHLACYGSMTFKRKKRQRGLEPDQCFWIQNELAVRGKGNIDLRQDPPPDLAIEIDWTHSSLNRMGIYAALRIPEVWQFDGQSLRVQLLGPDGKYAESKASLAFPFVAMKEVERLVRVNSTLSDSDLVRQFRAWVRERIAAEWK